MLKPGRTVYVTDDGGCKIRRKITDLSTTSMKVLSGAKQETPKTEYGKSPNGADTVAKGLSCQSMDTLSRSQRTRNEATVRF